MGKIHVLVGPSGSGKTFLSKVFLDSGFTQFITDTTRKPRVGEINNVSYYFQNSKEDFFAREKIEYIEYPKDSGELYGLSKKEVEQKSTKGDIVAVMNIDGALKLKEFYPQTKIIFIWAPIHVLKQRMIDRHDSEEKIKERLENISKSKEYENIKFADMVIPNLDEKYAKDLIKRYIKEEK